MTISDLYRFKGRTGRLAFALIQIGVFSFSYFATFLLIVLSGAGDEAGSGVTWMSQGVTAGLTGALAANAAWISLAAAVRRCHDRDLSGWMLLFAMPPILGQLWLVLCLITGPGSEGGNRHGFRRPTFPTMAAYRERPGLSRARGLA